MFQFKKNLVLLLNLMVLSFTSPRTSAEQVYSFPSLPAPISQLVEGGDGAFYGTSAGAGSRGLGAVFRVTSNGEMSVLGSFTGTNGSFPGGGLVCASDGNMYGMTTCGGDWNSGTVFRVGTNGIITSIYSFPDSFWHNGWLSFGLIQGSDGFLYGAAEWGIFRISLDGVLSWSLNSPMHGGVIEAEEGILYGISSYEQGESYADCSGSVFKVTTNGVRTSVAFFWGTNGSYPVGGLTPGDDGSLYGTTQEGADDDKGTIFRMTTNGEIKVLVSFGAYEVDDCVYLPDGGNPRARLTRGRDGLLYGTTSTGGAYGAGTVFSVSTNGVLKTLASFENGFLKVAGVPLVLGSDGCLYGTSDFDGPSKRGSVFRVTTGGMMTTLFADTNTEGACPIAGCTLGTDGALYGITPAGGANNSGAVFRLATNGVMTTVFSFENKMWFAPTPAGPLALGSDGAFYGVTRFGGAWGFGSVFRITSDGLLTTMASFSYDSPCGVQPRSGLVQGGDGAFYGTTSMGGACYGGSVYRATTNGELTPLAFFGSTNGSGSFGPMVQGRDGALYGTTTGDFFGSNGTFIGKGSVFRVATNGAFSTLSYFSSEECMATNASLLVGEDGALYGIAKGAVFKVAPDGQRTAVTAACGLTGDLCKGPDGVFYASGATNGRIKVCRICTNGVVSTVAILSPDEGTLPVGGLTLAGDGFLYGVASKGGARGGGSVYRAKLPDYRVQIRSLAFPCGWNVYVELRFQGMPASKYRMLRATNISGPWQLFGTFSTSVDGDGLVCDWRPPTNSAFYRIVPP
jgi:uncharacterized repeat protein (TIGR03803 family)